ncbi:MAG: ABC transporter ATP-binding protein [Candidatus Kariarchaeaceae archaeon]|jgi:ATP-binding cassette subfamily B protein
MSKKKNVIYSDADKEEARGSFGYSDIFLYKFMFNYVKPYKRDLSVILLLMITFAIATAIGPILLMITINRFVDNNADELFGITWIDKKIFSIFDRISSSFPSVDKIWIEVSVITTLYFFLQFVIFTMQRKQLMMTSEVGLKAEMTIRLDLFEHLQELDLSYHDKNEVGRIMSRLTSDVRAIREMLGGQVINNIANVITVFIVIIIILAIDVMLSIVAIILIPIVISIGTFSRRYTRPRRKETRRTNSIMMANIGESIAGIKVTKGHTRELQNINYFEKLNDENKQASINADDMNAFFFPIMLSMSTLGTALIVLVGGIRVIEGAITLGALVAFLNYNAILFRPVVLLGQFYQQLQDALTGAERVYALLDTDTRVPWNPDHPEMNIIKGEVSFEDIDFEYIPDELVYENFNLFVPRGQTVALVGKTGAGKSTIINILSRMYEFQSGELRIDGTEIHEVSHKSYMKQIASVPQDFFLFSTSIRENLKLGKPNATDEEMFEVLTQVGLYDYVVKLDEGLDTPLQERGGRLSVGQRQLLVFAAVLLANPRILILDEATSSIDVFSELQIQKAIKLLLANRTAFIIAHRLSTIRDADTIVVIDEGKIVEQGTHDQLVKLHGYYYNLVKNQVELSEFN